MVLATAVVCGSGQLLPAGPVLLQDDFNYADGLPDASKWSVAVPTGSGTADPRAATVQSGRLKIEGRAHLNSVSQFTPADYGGLTIRGRWEFGSSDDFLQILTRSSGTPSGTYGETSAGVEANASRYVLPAATNVNITHNGVSGGVGSVVNWQAPHVYDIEYADYGHLDRRVTLVMKQVGGHLAAVATALSNYAPTTNYVTIHNRENRYSYLDDVVVSAGTPEAAPAPKTLQGFTVRQVMSTGTLNSLADADALLAGTGIASEATGVYGEVNFLDTGSGGLFGGNSLFPNNTAGDDDNFAVSATAQLVVPTTADYVFGISANSAEGARLKIDGVTVVQDAGGFNLLHNTYGYTQLTAGTVHNLELVYFERTGDAQLELFYFDGVNRFLVGVPEPSSIALVLLGAVGLLLVRRFRGNTACR
jgi:hypothetical protein